MQCDMQVIYAIKNDKTVTLAYNRQQIGAVCLQGEGESRTLSIRCLAPTSEHLRVCDYSFFASTITRELTPEEVVDYFIKGNLWEPVVKPEPSISDILNIFGRGKENSPEKDLPKEQPKIKFKCPKCKEVFEASVIGWGNISKDPKDWEMACPNCGTKMTLPVDNVCPFGYSLGEECDRTP